MTQTASGASGARGERSRPARAVHRALLPAAAVTLVLLASACGGSSGEGVAQVGTTETTTTGPERPDGSQSANPAAYSACMRRNGVPEFPDPDANGSIQIGESSGLDTNSPQFKAADEGCKRLLPNGGTSDPQDQARELQEVLRYSACMRSHGVTNFPDPKPGNSGNPVTIGPLTGVDRNSPRYTAAKKACKDFLHGDDGERAK